MANTGRKIGVNIFTLMQNAGMSRKELADKFVPELQYMKEFSDPNNLDRILDLLDDYVELKEAM